MKPLDHHALADAVPARGPGVRLPETLARIKQCDAVLREMRLCDYAGPSGREAARQIRAALKLYRDGRWRRDRVRECPPDPSTARRWRYLKLRDAIPSFAKVRKVIGGY